MNKLPKEHMYYIAGPMTNYPQFNFPRFMEVAKHFTSQGYDMINPADLDIPAVKEEALVSVNGRVPLSGTIGGETWGDFLSRDVKTVADIVDAVLAIDRWYQSRGARLEVFTALQVGKPVWWWRANALSQMNADECLDLMTRSMTGARVISA